MGSLPVVSHHMVVETLTNGAAFARSCDHFEYVGNQPKFEHVLHLQHLNARLGQGRSFARDLSAPDRHVVGEPAIV